ncbi:hypothetical protein D9M70_481560 [compost metagenome]
MLLQQELDDFQAEGHVPGLVGLRREAEGDGGHVAVVGGTGHEGHEQQVGQHVLEAERDRREELEGAGGARVLEEGLGHREEPHPVMHVGEVMQAVEVLVVVAHGVDLGLHVAQLVDRLHLAGDPRTGATEVPADAGEALVGLVLQRGHAAEEQLQRVDVARVGQVGMAVVLGEGIEDGVELLLLLGLVLPVGVHGQAEGVLPLVPVGDLDALEALVGVDVFLALVARLPAEVAGQAAVLVFLVQAFGGHLGSPDSCCRARVSSSAGRNSLRPPRRCRRG